MSHWGLSWGLAWGLSWGNPVVPYVGPRLRQPWVRLGAGRYFRRNTYTRY